MEPSKKEKFNAAPPPTIAYTADVAMAVAANAAEQSKAKQDVSGFVLGLGEHARKA